MADGVKGSWSYEFKRTGSEGGGSTCSTVEVG